MMWASHVTKLNTEFKEWIWAFKGQDDSKKIKLEAAFIRLLQKCKVNFLFLSKKGTHEIKILN